jgi:uncharacterized membrane protein YgdD (TMEM256/DUF423 family)
MRLWIVLGAVNAFLAVAAGAFGAHGLRRIVRPELLTVFETGARYHMYHALALVAVGLVALHRGAPSGLLAASGWAFQVGIVLFTGSLYALTLTGMSRLGAITPLGGVAFLVGWALLAVAAAQTR